MTTRRCPDQLLWMRTSHVTWPTSLSLSFCTTAGSVKPWPAHSHESHMLWWPVQWLNKPSWTRNNSVKTTHKPSSFAASDGVALSTGTPPLVDTLAAALQQTNLPTAGLLRSCLGKELPWKEYSWVYEFKTCFKILTCTTQLALINTPSCAILCCSHHTQEIVYWDRWQYIVGVLARG